MRGNSRLPAGLRRELAQQTAGLAAQGHPPAAAARIAWERLRDQLLGSGEAELAAALYQEYLGATRHRGGVFYTPPALTRYLAAATLGPLLELEPSRPLRVLDPACGAGGFLQAALAVMAERGRPVRQALGGLYGVDLDAEALRLAAAALGQRAGPDGGSGGSGEGPHLEAGDALLRFPAWPGGFDAVLGNPPWGAEIAAPATDLAGRFTLAVEQFDSWALFVELATGLLRPGGRLGFVVPQGLLAQPNYAALRQHLLAHYDLERILNLGDGVFPGVAQPCLAFVAARTAARTAAPARGPVRVLAGLAPAERRRLVQGDLDLAAVEAARGHTVRAERFAADAGVVFDIYATDAEAALLARLEAQRCDWDRHLSSSRGVEIGKGGEVVRCPRCRHWNNVPLLERGGGYRVKRCVSCGGAIGPQHWDPADPDTYQVIVHDAPQAGTVPFLPGEAVGRYSLGPARHIRLGFEGIRYKDASLYQGPKILVRKTGAGLTATLDPDGHYTSQVVFILRPRPGSPLAPEYVLALINARVNWWYYYRRLQDAGRSTFPYVTQGLLKRLLLKEAAPRDQQPLVELVRARLVLGRGCGEQAREIEAEIDGRVAALFGVRPGDVGAPPSPA